MTCEKDIVCKVHRSEVILKEEMEDENTEHGQLKSVKLSNSSHNYIYQVEDIDIENYLQLEYSLENLMYIPRIHVIQLEILFTQ